VPAVPILKVMSQSIFGSSAIAYLEDSNFIFEMRIGINSGPVIAGIGGSKNFEYDILGDTLNTASSMKQKGEAGKINISGSTSQIIKNTLILEY
jgi:adenylate cyclase